MQLNIILGVLEGLGLGVTFARGVERGDLGVVGPRFSL